MILRLALRLLKNAFWERELDLPHNCRVNEQWACLARGLSEQPSSRSLHIHIHIDIHIDSYLHARRMSTHFDPAPAVSGTSPFKIAVTLSAVISRSSSMSAANRLL